MTDEYKCVMQPPLMTELKSKEMVVTYETFEVEGFTMVDGQMIPSGDKFRMTKIVDISWPKRA